MGRSSKSGTVASLVTVLDPDLYPDGLSCGYGTDACIDLRIAKASWLPAFKTYQAPLGIRVDVPEGHAGWIVARGSSARNGIHVAPVAIDHGYEGEVHTWLTCPRPIRYNRGDTLVGLCIMPILLPGAKPRKRGPRGAQMLGSSGS